MHTNKRKLNVSMGNSTAILTAYCSYNLLGFIAKLIGAHDIPNSNEYSWVKLHPGDKKVTDIYGRVTGARVSLVTNDFVH